MNREWPTQKARVLAWTQAGKAARQYEWMQTPAPDGGPPIMRLAAIIGFLEEDGHRFHKNPIGGGQVEYRLAHSEPPEIPSRDAPVDVDPVEQLPLLDGAAAPRSQPERRWRGYDCDGDE